MLVLIVEPESGDLACMMLNIKMDIESPLTELHQAAMLVRTRSAVTNHWHNLKKASKIRVLKKTNNNNIIDFPYGIINSDKQIFCWIKGVNNDLVYQLEHKNKVIKLSMNKLLNTLN